MQFSVDANVLKKLIANVSGNLSKDTNSILNNYLVSVKNGAILVTSANNAVQASASVPIEGDAECTFLAKPDLFNRLKVLEGNILFDLKENLLTIKNGAFKTTAKVLDAQDYPLQLIDDYKMAYSFDLSDISELLKVYIASSKEEEVTREFNGVLIDINSKNINFVATNRARLFWISKPIEEDVDFYCIIEKDSILQLGRILKAEDTKAEDTNNNTVNLLYKSNGENITSIAFQIPNHTIISKAINGRFPQYQGVTLENADDKQCVAFDRELLKTALNRVLALNNNELSAVEFNLQENDAQLNITNKEGETASDVVEFTSCNHTPTVLMLNGHFAVDFLSSIQFDAVNFYYKDTKKIVEFKATSESGINYIYVMTISGS